MNKLLIITALVIAFLLVQSASIKCSDLPEQPKAWDKATTELYATCR